MHGMHGMHQLFATGRSLRKALACLGTSALLNVPQQFQAGAAWNHFPGFSMFPGVLLVGLVD